MNLISKTDLNFFQLLVFLNKKKIPGQWITMAAYVTVWPKLKPAGLWGPLYPPNRVIFFWSWTEGFFPPSHKLTFAGSHSCLFKKHWGLEAGICLRSYINSKLFPGICLEFKTSSFLPVTTFWQCLPPARVGADGDRAQCRPSCPHQQVWKLPKFKQKIFSWKFGEFYPLRKELGDWRSHFSHPAV